MIVNLKVSHWSTFIIAFTHVGTVSLKHIDHKSKSVEFEVVVHSAYHRQGVASQAMTQIAKYGFKVMRLECIFFEHEKI